MFWLLIEDFIIKRNRICRVTSSRKDHRKRKLRIDLIRIFRHGYRTFSCGQRFINTVSIQQHQRVVHLNDRMSLIEHQRSFNRQQCFIQIASLYIQNRKVQCRDGIARISPQRLTIMPIGIIKSICNLRLNTKPDPFIRRLDTLLRHQHIILHSTVSSYQNKYPPTATAIVGWLAPVPCGLTKIPIVVVPGTSA